MLLFKQRVRKAGFMLVVLTLASFAFGAEQQAPATETPREIGQNPATKQDEVAVLKAQLEQMRFYDARLLATVYWALGALGAITVGIIGFGWFANFKVYERDKAQLTEFLQEKLETGSNATTQEIEGRVIKTIEARVKTLSQSVNSSVAALRREY